VARHGWRILIVFHIDTPSPLLPSTFIRPSHGLTAWSRRQSDVVCCSPRIIGVINADRENPMCARAKRVTRLQKRSLVRERDADVNRMRRVGTCVIFLRPATKSSAPVYRRDVIYDEHCLRTFIWFHKSFLRETSFLIGVYLRTAKKSISCLADILNWVWNRVKNSSEQRGNKIFIEKIGGGINAWCKWNAILSKMLDFWSCIYIVHTNVF